jgi:hypothetical protein
VRPGRLPTSADETFPERGYDELNLAEFPLASISDRHLDGTKTVVFEDQVWDPRRRLHVPRKLAISGSDRYGLPAARDDDVLLACIQLSSLGDFASRRVQFSRYELLKLLRWKDETRNYRRLAVSLRRWKGLSIFSTRAFFDKARQSWVNKDFGVFDNLHLFQREEEEGIHAPASSWFLWNEVLLSSFQAGYLKRLDWSLYCRLESPVAKRLYRFLDKRFYHGSRVEIDLHELSLRKVRLSDNYNTAQMKRALLKGIRELEAAWDLKPLEEGRRFVKAGSGTWSVAFERKAKRRKSASDRPTAKPDSASPATPTPLTDELVRREVSLGVAAELVAAADARLVRRMIELYDWYRERQCPRGPGFLVMAIKNPDRITLPREFTSSEQRAARRQAEQAQKRAQRDELAKREAKLVAAEKSRDRRFLDFWTRLSAPEQKEFEAAALHRADATTRAGYRRTRGANPTVFEQYRHIILRTHFERSEASTAA